MLGLKLTNSSPTVVRPYVAPKNINFVTVKGGYGFQEDGFFQAFWAAEKGHPIIHRSLSLMLEYLKKNKGNYLGPLSLLEAWKEFDNRTNATTSKESNEVYLLMELNLMKSVSAVKHELTVDYVLNSEIYKNMIQKVPSHFRDSCQFSAGQCNFIVMDENDQTIYMYSRILGTKWCGKRIRTNCTTAGMSMESLGLSEVEAYHR